MGSVVPFFFLKKKETFFILIETKQRRTTETQKIKNIASNQVSFLSWFDQLWETKKWRGRGRPVAPWTHEK